ncbi:MAG: prolyl oligopeptidase family serine peptidase, partial [Chloroflexi bacterium]|nr:prolyl oligopeptidase family serine peptidase [Chloroflexota bacterium]
MVAGRLRALIRGDLTVRPPPATEGSLTLPPNRRAPSPKRRAPQPKRRPPQPEDFYRIRVVTDARLSPDASQVAFTVQSSAPSRTGYRSAIWLGPTDGSEAPRQVTLGAKNDTQARFSPDGRTLAFLSDRRPLIEDEPDASKDREDGTQVHLLPLDGPGEARRLTNLPRGVNELAWSPDGSRLAILSSSRGGTHKDDAKARGKRDAKPGEPLSDYRYTDRLGYLANGPGFIQGIECQLWIVDVASGAARAITKVRTGIEEFAWSPDGKRIAFAAQSNRDFDLRYRSQIVVVDVDTGRRTVVAGGPDDVYFVPTWLPDGRSIAALGGRMPGVYYESAVWVFEADGSDGGGRGGRDLTSRHDLMPAATMNSDLTKADRPRLVPSPDGRALLFLAPHAGAYELWRVEIEDGSVTRLTDGRHDLSGFDAVPLRGGSMRVAAVRSTPTEPADVHVGDLKPGAARLALKRVSDVNRDLLDELALIEPLERHVTLDGNDVQGWLLPSGRGRRPTVVEIHGGPHTFYGWSPLFEFQILAGAGMSVFYSNPRGSEGYGRAFNEGSLQDWGPGPMRDVLAGVDALVADGLADPQRLGVTGGSYGGYLTSWIVAHDHRFAAALTARSVADMAVLFLTGDLAGTEWPTAEFG